MSRRTKPLTSAPSPEEGKRRWPTATDWGSVLVWDQRREVAAELARWVSDAGARVLEVSEKSSLHSSSASECEIAVVGISSEDRKASEVISGLRDLSQHGMTIVGCTDAGPALSLPTRCQFLLAGCACLLDRACATFGSELAGRVVAELRSASERRAEESAVLLEMARHGIIGRTHELVAAFRGVQRASKFSDLPVLITGETGTGKELFARALHALDPARRGGKFVALNAASMNAQLAESELFGHRRGAFTGAERDRPGLFRTAHRGILFFDEIGEMAPPIQGKLLRVIQDGRLYGLGEDREIAVDVRVVAATHRPLEEMVSAGTFREDLFHRLSVFRIHLPPLRKRIEDFGALVEHCLARLRARSPTCSTSAAAEFLEALGSLGLRGNVRELESLVRDSALRRTDGRPLTLADLPPRALEQISARSAPEPAGVAARAPNVESGESDGERFVRLARTRGWNLAAVLQHIERQVIESVLREAHGSHARAAQLLGVTPRTIYNKLRKHCITF